MNNDLYNLRHPTLPQKVEVNQHHKHVPYQILPPFMQDFLDEIAEELVALSGIPEDPEKPGTKRFFNFFHAWRIVDGHAPNEEGSKCGFTLITSYSPFMWSMRIRWYSNFEGDQIVFQPSKGDEPGPDKQTGLKVPKNILKTTLRNSPTNPLANKIYNFIEQIFVEELYGPGVEIFTNGSVGRMESSWDKPRESGRMVQEVDKVGRRDDRSPNQTLVKTDTETTRRIIDAVGAKRNTERATSRRRIEPE